MMLWQIYHYNIAYNIAYLLYADMTLLLHDTWVCLKIIKVGTSPLEQCREMHWCIVLHRLFVKWDRSAGRASIGC